MDSVVTYGYREDGAASMHPAALRNYSSIDEEMPGLMTEYKSRQMLEFSLTRQLDTTSHHTDLFQGSLFLDNLIGNASISKQISHHDLVLKSYNEQFGELAQFFGFNKTEWADIFSVSRPTIYGWLKNELKPSGKKASKISQLYSLLVAIPNRRVGDRLFRRYICHHISACNCSLFEIFKSGIPSEYEGSDLVEIISLLLKRAQKKSKELDDLEKTGLASESTLAHNLDDLLNCSE
ncbi:MAG: hypothetical protein JEY71_01545 [Sphaerochaeta sp.]|nr:hypothetical protein [Sphaerochaeta sp.]